MLIQLAKQWLTGVGIVVTPYLTHIFPVLLLFISVCKDSGWGKQIGTVASDEVRQGKTVRSVAKDYFICHVTLSGYCKKSKPQRTRFKKAAQCGLSHQSKSLRCTARAGVDWLLDWGSRLVLWTHFVHSCTSSLWPQSLPWSMPRAPTFVFLIPCFLLRRVIFCHNFVSSVWSLV